MLSKTGGGRDQKPSSGGKHFLHPIQILCLNYANIAQQSGVDQLIIGGKALLPTFEGGLLPDGSDSPANFDDRWNALINEIRAHYERSADLGYQHQLRNGSLA
jgi:hypothetical protein